MKREASNRACRRLQVKCGPLGFVLLALLPCSTSWAGGLEPPTSTLRATSCPAQSGLDRCGYVQVPLNHAQPGGRQIEVFVSIKASISSLRKSDPVFYLPGGPGSEASSLVGWLAGHTITDRDVVGLDYRGAGRSRPALDCPDRAGAALDTCRRAWQQQGLALQFFNTVQAAQDIEAVRVALGYGQINLYAASYGTVWAQEAMRRSPSHLRSVILAGVIPAELNYWEALLPALEQLTRKLLQACEQNAGCDRTYPELVTRFDQQFAALPRPTREAVVSLIQVIGGDSRDLGRIPGLVHAALEGQPLPARQAFRVPAVPTSNGLNVVVNCQEQWGFSSSGQWRAANSNARAFAGLEQADEAFATCKALGLSRAAPEFHQPVRTNLPTLLIGGEFDSRTPVDWLERFSPLPSRWQRIVLQGEGHTGDWFPCGSRIVQDFLRNPAGKLDAACAETGRVDFR